MDAKYWTRVNDAFSFAIAHGPASAGNALNEACAGDEQLLSHLRPLVEEHFRILNEAAAPQPLVESELETPGIIADRYRIVSRLGSGTFGDVYRISDMRNGGEDLALKVLRSPDPVALQYFKREFRSLAGIYHPNIIRLHELTVHRDQWMLTMEFVDGTDVLRFLALQAKARQDSALRSCFLQIATGLRTLHEAKLLHRDIKPSNVLVTPAGRVVILDFGLARPFEDALGSVSTFAGTPDFISPEQAKGGSAGKPSDWYAFGVMLYRSLTGQRPFEGNLIEVLQRKQNEIPIAPVALVPDISSEMNSLCLKLLERDPAKRANYRDVMEVLQPDLTVSVRSEQIPSIVGRREPLRCLLEGFALTEERPALIHLCGPSGIGKTALLREFTTRLGKDPSTLVFVGRCYEGEAIPYRALDDLIDHIAQYFRRLTPEGVERILPRNFSLLVKMFPVFAPFLSSDTQSSSNIGSTELRIRALGALRELLGRLRERCRIVLVIDDLHWGDADGCGALNELFSSADAPAILAVLAYRSEDIAAAQYVQDLRRQTAHRTTQVIELENLGLGECRQLAESLLGQPLTPNILQRIAEQSEGNPFLVQEIVKWVAANVTNPTSVPFSLADVVRSRVEKLTRDSRHLLELVAVAGQPTELTALQVAGKTHVLYTRDELISNRLLRLRTVRGREEVEIYHDRIRTTILSEMEPAEQIRCHRELARALESIGGHDPERIAEHYGQAKDLKSCATYALIAARRANDKLAFNEASRFFEMALSTATLDSGAIRQAHRDCGDALSNAGRGMQAAEHYIAACRDATIDEQLESSLRAAEELLHSGHVDRGLAIFRAVLQQVGVRAPNPASQLPLDFLIARARLRFRGLSWRERPTSEISRAELLRVDTCASVATGLALIDVMGGTGLQTKSLLLALRAGEPRRIARALATEAGYRSTVGVRVEKSARIVLERGRELANRTADPRTIGLAGVMEAAFAWNMGHWQTCYERARAAQRILRDCHGRVTWERDTASIFEVDGLRWMGRWTEMKRTLPALIEDARSRGDLYAESIFQMHGGSCTELANDNPTRALEGLRILERWSNTGFHVEHLVETHNRVEIALYLGQGEQALNLLLSRWPALRRSFLLRVQTLNIQMRSLLARVLLAAASSQSPGLPWQKWLRMAQRECLLIRRENTTWGSVFSLLTEGGIKAVVHRREDAIESFRKAEEAATSAGMLLHIQIARRARGLLKGGGAGTALVTSANTALKNEGIVDTDRFAAIITPGNYIL